MYLPFSKNSLLERISNQKGIGAGTDGRFLTLLLCYRTIVIIGTEVCGSYKYFVPFFGIIALPVLFIYKLRYMPFYNLKMCIAQGVMMAFTLGGTLTSFFANVFPRKEYIILVFLSIIPLALLSIVLIIIRFLIWETYFSINLQRIGEEASLFELLEPFDFDYEANRLTNPEKVDQLFKIGYEKFKNSSRMRVFYSLHLFNVKLESNRHIIHTLGHRVLGFVFWGKFFNKF